MESIQIEGLSKNKSQTMDFLLAVVLCVGVIGWPSGGDCSSAGNGGDGGNGNGGYGVNGITQRNRATEMNREEKTSV